MVEKILSLMLGGTVIGFGIYNLIIWKLIKNEGCVIKAKLVGRCPTYRGRIYGTKGCVVEYTINDKEYRRELIVTKDAPLYYRNYGK